MLGLRITGRTRVLFILADPVDHVIGSHRLNERFAAERFDVAVVPLHVRPANLLSVVGVVRSLGNVAGFGVTIPHKIAVMPLLDALTPRAARIGAVNFVRRADDGRLTGDNLDGQGFVDGLSHSGIPIRGRRILQIGAGGAGRAVAFGVAGAGAASLVIHNRTTDRARMLAGDVMAAFPNCLVSAGSNDPEGYDLVINTTSMGMHEGDKLPLDVRRLSATTDVAEVIMTPEITPLLAAAGERGCRVATGFPMLDAQYGLVKKLLNLTG